MKVYELVNVIKNSYSSININNYYNKRMMGLISDKGIDDMFYPSEELLNAEIVDTMYENETNTLIIYVIK